MEYNYGIKIIITLKVRKCFVLILIFFDKPTHEFRKGPCTQLFNWLINIKYSYYKL